MHKFAVQHQWYQKSKHHSAHSLTVQIRSGKHNTGLSSHIINNSCTLVVVFIIRKRMVGVGALIYSSKR